MAARQIQRLSATKQLSRSATRLLSSTTPQRCFVLASRPAAQPLNRSAFHPMAGSSPFLQKRNMGVKVPDEDKRAIMAAFDLIDLNEDGVIDQAEQTALAVMLGDAGFGDMDDLLASFKAVDTNQDGEVSKEEFIAWWTSKMHSSKDICQNKPYFLNLNMCASHPHCVSPQHTEEDIPPVIVTTYSNLNHDS